MICPIFYASAHPAVESECKEGRCAWWDDEGARCAVLDFARMFSNHLKEEE